MCVRIFIILTCDCISDFLCFRLSTGLGRLSVSWIWVVSSIISSSRSGLTTVSSIVIGMGIFGTSKSSSSLLLSLSSPPNGDRRYSEPSFQWTWDRFCGVSSSSFGKLFLLAALTSCYGKHVSDSKPNIVFSSDPIAT